MGTPLKPRVTLWALCFLLWTVLGLFMFSQPRRLGTLQR